MPTYTSFADLAEALKMKGTEAIKTLVGHQFPDDDVWLCLWMAKKFIASAAEAQIQFVNAGETLPGSENDPSILHFDTGGGAYDQHGKQLRHSSSAAILREKLGLMEDPGLNALVAMVTAVDNVEPLEATSIHFAIVGYPRMFRDNQVIHWNTVQERVFELFDIIYGQETGKARSRVELAKHVEWVELPNNLKVACIFWHPELREAAFEQGAAVVVWTQAKGKMRCYVGVQRNRELPLLRLDNVAAALRFEEARKRGIDVRGKDLKYMGREKPVDNWFLHDSSALVLSGSRTWTLTEEEFTKLSPRDIQGAVLRGLTSIPKTLVEEWRKVQK